MDCRDALERLSDYRDGALPADVTEKVSLHLKACAECSAADRSLGAVRDHLRNLPPVPAPPELFTRVREALAREAAFAPSAAAASPADPPVRSVFSRMKIPLEAAAVVLLAASVYWFRTASTPPAVPPAPGSPPGIASSAPPPAPVRTARATPRPKAAPSSAGKGAAESGTREAGISSLPADTPEPKIRVWSRADLPAVPVLRTSTNFDRIVPGLPADGPAEESEYRSRTAESGSPPGDRGAAAAQPARLRPLLPYGRMVSMEVAMEDRDRVEERIGDAARRLGGTVEGTDRVVPDGPVAVRVLLPERTAQAFLEELDRIGKIPPEGMPARSVLPPGPAPGTIAYTVRLRTR